MATIIDMNDMTNFSEYNQSEYKSEQAKNTRYNKFDKGLNIIKRKVNVFVKKEGDDNGYYVKRNRPIVFYTSGDVGSAIRDAVTGMYVGGNLHTVGSIYEDKYFKHILATGECKSANNSRTLFYLNPKDYEDQFNVELSEDVVNKWQEKYNKFMG
jgi:hypothetical protein